jgi:hypothetical protein
VRGRRRRGSELDDVRPHDWHASWTAELVALIRVLRRSVDLQQQQDDLLERICDAPFMAAKELPAVDPAQRAVPATERANAPPLSA